MIPGSWYALYSCILYHGSIASMDTQYGLVPQSSEWSIVRGNTRGMHCEYWQASVPRVLRVLAVFEMMCSGYYLTRSASGFNTAHTTRSVCNSVLRVRLYLILLSLLAASAMQNTKILNARAVPKHFQVWKYPECVTTKVLYGYSQDVVTNQ